MSHFYMDFCCLIQKIMWNQWFVRVLFGEGDSTPLQYSLLENPMDRGAWQTAAHGVAKGRTRLSDFTFTFHFHALEKEMATHSSVLAWRIPGTGEPGGLLSVGSHTTEVTQQQQQQQQGSFQVITSLLLLFSCSIMFDSLQLYGLQPARLLCPWNFLGKNTGVGCYFLLQGIFLTQGSN